MSDLQSETNLPAVNLTYFIHNEKTEEKVINGTNVTTGRLGLAEGVLPVKVCNMNIFQADLFIHVSQRRI
jgi:hypothetical protein